MSHSFIIIHARGGPFKHPKKSITLQTTDTQNAYRDWTLEQQNRDVLWTISNGMKKWKSIKWMIPQHSKPKILFNWHRGDAFCCRLDVARFETSGWTKLIETTEREKNGKQQAAQQWAKRLFSVDNSSSFFYWFETYFMRKNMVFVWPAGHICQGDLLGEFQLEAEIHRWTKLRPESTRTEPFYNPRISAWHECPTGRIDTKVFIISVIVVSMVLRYVCDAVINIMQNTHCEKFNSSLRRCRCGNGAVKCAVA